MGRRRYSSQQKMEVARLLLENGAGVTTKDDDERTALYRTANRGIRRCCSSCSRRRANVAAKDDKGLTALHQAVVKLLLEKGADITTKW